MNVNIGRLDLFSSTAYPNMSSAVIYFAGCNMRCPWCWTHEMIKRYSGEEMEVEELVKEINDNPSELEAIVIDGGEPTQQPEALFSLCKLLKEEGYLIQVNTNGSDSEVIDEIGIRGNIDRLGLDIKAPLDFARRYSKATGVRVGEELKENIEGILRASSLCKYELEPRTTIVHGINDSRHQVEKIAEKLSFYTDNYALQAFTPEKGTLNKEYEAKEEVTREKLLELSQVAKRHLSNVMIRTHETGLERV